MARVGIFGLMAEPRTGNSGTGLEGLTLIWDRPLGQEYCVTSRGSRFLEWQS